MELDPKTSELRSHVKVEVAALGVSLIDLMVFQCGCKATLNLNLNCVF